MIHEQSLLILAALSILIGITFVMFNQFDC